MRVVRLLMRVVRLLMRVVRLLMRVGCWFVLLFDALVEVVVDERLLVALALVRRCEEFRHLASEKRVHRASDVHRGDVDCLLKVDWADVPGVFVVR